MEAQFDVEPLAGLKILGRHHRPHGRDGLRQVRRVNRHGVLLLSWNVMARMNHRCASSDKAKQGFDRRFLAKKLSTIMLWRKAMRVPALLLVVASLSLSTAVAAFEIDGFRSGMPIEDAIKIAKQKGFAYN